MLIRHCLILLSTAVLLSACNAPAFDASLEGSSEKSTSGPPGLTPSAAQELRDSGVDQYLGMFEADSSPFGVWTKHTFDAAGGNGPICIGGTDYSVFTKEGDPKKLLIFLQGGGACWQDFYQCNVLAEAQFPPPDGVAGGIFDPTAPGNPFADYSVVYMPYCDGSAWGGDNQVFDPTFGEAIGVPEAVVRFHRGLRNVSAGMDVAAETFPKANRVTVAGSSAGGVGVASWAPFLARFVFGNKTKLTVFDDAGPIVVNLGAQVGVAARAADWDFEKLYPESCEMDMDFPCAADGQQTAIINWRLNNDATVREAFYETDADGTNSFFVAGNFTFPSPFVPGAFTPLFGLSGDQYRQLLLAGTSFDPFGAPIGSGDGQDALHAAHPTRYKRFIVAGDTSHTALQSGLFYTQEANGVLLNDWTSEFLIPGAGNSQGFWDDIVEDPAPAE